MSTEAANRVSEIACVPACLAEALLSYQDEGATIDQLLSLPEKVRDVDPGIISSVVASFMEVDNPQGILQMLVDIACPAAPPARTAASEPGWKAKVTQLRQEEQDKNRDGSAAISSASSTAPQYQGTGAAAAWGNNNNNNNNNNAAHGNGGLNEYQHTVHPVPPPLFPAPKNLHQQQKHQNQSAPAAASSSPTSVNQDGGVVYQEIYVVPQRPPAAAYSYQPQHGDASPYATSLTARSAVVPPPPRQQQQQQEQQHQQKPEQPTRPSAAPTINNYQTTSAPTGYTSGRDSPIQMSSLHPESAIRVPSEVVPTRRPIPATTNVVVPPDTASMFDDIGNSDIAPSRGGNVPTPAHASSGGGGGGGMMFGNMESEVVPRYEPTPAHNMFAASEIAPRRVPSPVRSGGNMFGSAESEVAPRPVPAPVHSGGFMFGSNNSEIGPRFAPAPTPNVGGMMFSSMESDVAHRLDPTPTRSGGMMFGNMESEVVPRYEPAPAHNMFGENVDSEVGPRPDPVLTRGGGGMFGGDGGDEGYSAIFCAFQQDAK